MLFEGRIRRRIRAFLADIPQDKVININEYFKDYIETVKREWEERGYYHGSIDSAVRMTEQYVYRMAKEIAPDDIYMQNKIIISWFPTALRKYGEKFIKGVKEFIRD